MKFFYYIFLWLMLAGNCFGLFQLWFHKEIFQQKFPALDNRSILFLQVLPVINIIGIAGMLLLKSWSPYVAVAGAMLVIAADVYFGIHYHLWIAVPAALILIFLITRYWEHIK